MGNLRSDKTVVGIIQARMGSSRLPGKVMLPLNGRPVLEHVVERVARCTTIDKIVVATSESPRDDEIANFCFSNKIHLFRGSEDDVLSRYWVAATESNADWILRITADCPAIDSEILDHVVERAVEQEWDCFGLGGSFPNGLDCTVYSYAALTHAFHAAVLPSDREHVGPFIIRNLKTGSYEPFRDAQHFRFTLDEPEDYEVLKHIFETLGSNQAYFSGHEVLSFLVARPDIRKINSHIPRNAGYLRSLEAERTQETRRSAGDRN